MLAHIILTATHMLGTEMKHCESRICIVYNNLIFCLQYYIIMILSFVMCKKVGG